MGSSGQKYSIYLLDNYSVRLDRSLSGMSYKKGWILVLIGGGITGDVQTNYTALHHKLKSLYRAKGEKLVYKKLRENKDRIPKLTRDEIMELLTESYQGSGTNQSQSFKVNWITNSLDGS